MRIAVVGLGLIGGSLALAASSRGDQVAGCARHLVAEAGRIGLDRGRA
jgi:prephenate dehydrogenase